MNKQEFAVIAVGIKSAYPASKILEDDASMNFWYRMLKDLNGKVVENAVMEHISTSVYPPNIAEIRKNNKVVQCRGKSNCGMPPDVKAFVQVFEKKMQDAIQKGDTNGKKKQNLQSA